MAHLTHLGEKQLVGRRVACKVAGFAYIALLVALAVLGLILGVATEQIEHAAQREREAQLLFVGKQFRQAVASYYEQSPGTKQYPLKLEELLQDKRFLKPIRHLRRIYIDPMTLEPDWQLARNAQGRVVGVYSRSSLEPIRTQLDADLLKAIGDKPVKYYSDWKFVYQPVDGSADILRDDDGDGMFNDANNSNSSGSPFGQLSNEGGLEQNALQQNSPEENWPEIDSQ
jgi:type II secretory pathway pseudopilin PulG